MNLRFSVIIPVYNAQSSIRRCLDSLREIDYPNDRYEVVLVDNGSTDGSREIMREYPFRIVDETRKNAFSARNCGIRNSSGEILILTDSDCVVSSGWLKAFDESFGDDDIMACGGKIVSFPPKNIIEEFPEFTLTHDNYINIMKAPLFLPWIDTANAAYRREIFENIGLFDDIHFEITGDVDMGWRVSLAGYRIAYNDGALVQHINRGVMKALVRQYYQYGYAEIRRQKKYAYYYKKVLGFGTISGMWKYQSICHIFFRAFRNFFSNISMKGLALLYLQTIVGLANLRGMIHEMDQPKVIHTDQAALDAVAPKPLKDGYLVWGDDEEKYLYNFAAESRMIVNDFGLFILEHLKKKSPFEYIVEKASMEWDADKELIAADVSEFITNLQPTGLLNV